MSKRSKALKKLVKLKLEIPSWARWADGVYACGNKPILYDVHCGFILPSNTAQLRKKSSKRPYKFSVGEYNDWKERFPARSKLKRTGKKIKFLDVSIGGPFYAHHRIWVRTSYDAATEFGSTAGGKHRSCCNFTLDKKDEIVEEVDVV